MLLLSTNSVKNKMPTKPHVEIYVDGACSGNPGPGGWGALMIYEGKRKEALGYALDTTNNQMEILAAIEALKLLKKSCRVKIYTDSTYVMDGITKWIHNWQRNNWRKSDNQPVKNADLWRGLQEESAKHEITWSWVKGHSSNEGNDIADSLAVRGREIAKEMMMEKLYATNK